MKKQYTWFSRWRVYPWSCAGHVTQGIAAGALAGAGHHWPAAVWFTGYLAYQFGSGARKAVNRHETDTIGLDSFDFTVGFLPGYAIATAVRMLV